MNTQAQGQREPLQIGSRVIHPDTGKEAVITRFVNTRFGVLAQLDNVIERAWLPHTLSPAH